MPKQLEMPFEYPEKLTITLEPQAMGIITELVAWYQSATPEQYEALTAGLRALTDSLAPFMPNTIDD